MQVGLDDNPFGRHLRIAQAFIGSEFDHVDEAFLLDSLVELALHEFPETGCRAPGHLVFVSLSPHAGIPYGAAERGLRFFRRVAGGPFLRFQVGNPALQPVEGGFALA